MIFAYKADQHRSIYVTTTKEYIMRGYLEDERASRLLFVGIWLVYMITCLTRNTYASAMSAIVSDGLFTKSATGTINAAFYLFYGSVQFLGGYLSDRISPFTILSVGLFGALVCNAVMASTESYTVMLITWSLNGICQFGVWPATLKIITSVLKKEHRKSASLYISVCMCTGGILSYFAAMILLRHFNWPSLFFLSSFLLAAVTVMWIAVTVKTKKKLITAPSPDEIKGSASSQKQTPSGIPVFRLMAISGFFLLILPSTIRAILDNGVKSWVPTMMMESYGITPAISSMIAALVLLINISGVWLTNKLYPRLCSNASLITGFFFLAALPLFALLLFIGRLPILITILLLFASTTAMYSINQLMNIEIPAAFGIYNRTGTIAGINNAFGSFGIMLGNLLFGFLADYSGWTAVIVSWLIFAALSMACCFAAAPLWKRFTMRKG